MDIPYADLSGDALKSVIESYVNRSGTDYGEFEQTLERKVEDVRLQLVSGEAKIVFDPETESIDIVVVD